MEELSESTEATLPQTIVTPVSLVQAFVGTLKPATHRSYLYSLEALRSWAGFRDVPELATRLCRMSGAEANILIFQYVETLAGRTPSTVNARLQGLRSFVKLGRALGVINWTLEVPQARVERYKDTRGPGIQIVRQLIGLAAADQTAAGIRNHALLRLLNDLALRRASIASLDLEHWERDRKALWVLTKGRYERRKKDLPHATHDALERWVQVRGLAPGPLFVRIRHGHHATNERLRADGIYRVVVALGEQIKSPRKVRPHGIRHTAISSATRAARAAHLGLEAVLAFSDHQNVQTLKFYLDEEDGLQRQISELVAAQAGSNLNNVRSQR
jgi:integrase